MEGTWQRFTLKHSVLVQRMKNQIEFLTNEPIFQVENEKKKKKTKKRKKWFRARSTLLQV